jgi:hypothetical protein
MAKAVNLEKFKHRAWWKQRQPLLGEFSNQPQPFYDRLAGIFREILRPQQCLALLGYARLNALLRKCAYGNVIGMTVFIHKFADSRGDGAEVTLGDEFSSSELRPFWPLL